MICGHQIRPRRQCDIPPLVTSLALSLNASSSCLVGFLANGASSMPRSKMSSYPAPASDALKAFTSRSWDKARWSLKSPVISLVTCISAQPTAVCLRTPQALGLAGKGKTMEQSFAGHRDGSPQALKIADQDGIGEMCATSQGHSQPVKGIRNCTPQ